MIQRITSPQERNLWLRRLANLVLIGSWIWLFHPIYPYLKTIFTREEFRTNQIVLLGALALIGLQVHRGALHPNISSLPQLNYPALVLTLTASAAFLLAVRFLDINTLSASLFGLASYGLFGLWLDPLRWRFGLPAALLLIGALPFGDHMQTFIGYPVRILTASIVGKGFSALGVHSISLETILVFENGISQVDLPCSGVKSLWTGGLFLLAATWIEQKPLNLRWLLAALVFAALLLTANLARVAILVGIGQVMGWILLAEMLHVPLGVLGFMAACLAALGMLRWVSPKRSSHAIDTVSGSSQIEPAVSGSTQSFSREMPRPVWLNPLLIIFILVLVFLYAPRPLPATAQSLPEWQIPNKLHAVIWPLSQDEVDWLAIDGADSASRWNFTWDDSLQGSLLFVSSTTWRAQHRPERCFEVYGLTVHGSRTVLITNDLPVRVLSLGQINQTSLLSAVYWFQSASLATDDYAARIWSDLSPNRARWVLVTVLFDRLVNPNSPDIKALLTTLQISVQQSLNGGKLP